MSVPPCTGTWSSSHACDMEKLVDKKYTFGLAVVRIYEKELRPRMLQL